MRKIISRIFILAGILLLLATAGLVGYNFYDSWRAGKKSAEILEKIDDQIDSEESTTESSAETGDTEEIPLYELYPDMSMPAVTIDGYRYIATLKIPSIDLKLPVMEEWDYQRLKIAPCCYSGSIYMHDIVIAGHNYGKHFSPIKWLKEGTSVILTDMDKNVFKYEVSYTEVIHPEDVDAMILKTVDDDWDLTLFTCTTGGGSRYALRCVMVDDKPHEE